MYTKEIFFMSAVLGSIASVMGVVALNSTLHERTAFAAQENKASIVPGASTLADKAYSPDPIKVKAGNTVTWTNDDTSFHTVTSGTGPNDSSKGKEFDSGLSGPNALTTKGKTFSHVFDKSGEFPYFCQLHPTMVGKVVVS
jgi:plastocyanin